MVLVVEVAVAISSSFYLVFRFVLLLLTCVEMDEAELVDETLALLSFSASRPADDEEYLAFGQQLCVGICTGAYVGIGAGVGTGADVGTGVDVGRERNVEVGAKVMDQHLQ